MMSERKYIRSGWTLTVASIHFREQTAIQVTELAPIQFIPKMINHISTWMKSKRLTWRSKSSKGLSDGLFDSDNCTSKSSSDFLTANAVDVFCNNASHMEYRINPTPKYESTELTAQSSAILFRHNAITMALCHYSFSTRIHECINSI